MKNIIKRFWGVGLIVIILSSLFIVASPVSAADPLRWESKTGGPSSTYNVISPGNTVIDFIVSPNGATVYAATANISGTGGKLFQSVNGGSQWTDITSRLPSTWTGLNRIDFLAMAPDDPNTVAVVGDNSTIFYGAISVNGGVTFTDMVMPSSPTTVIRGLDISAIVTGGFRYVVAFGTSNSGAAGSSVLYYFNYGAGVGGWKNAVTQFTTTPTSGLPVNAATMNNIVAFAFSPNFASDYMAVAVSEQKGDSATIPGILREHVLSFNSFCWDARVATNYPVAVATETGVNPINVAKASVALDPAYMGGDETLRLAFIGVAYASTPATLTGGVYRDNDSTASKKILDGYQINSVTYDGTNLVVGQYDTNNVWHCADMLGSSPTFVGARSMKRIGVDQTSFDDQVNVMFVGANVWGSKRGLGGAISKSTDAGNTWNDFTLINMNISGVTNAVWEDVMPSADGSTWYVSISDINNQLSTVFRMSPMQRVLCDNYATAGALALRGLASDPNVVYAFSKTGTTIYYSADGGVTRWQQRLNVPATITDLAVESSTVIYFANLVNVYKSVNNGFTWNLPVNTTSGTPIYSLLSLGTDKLVAGLSSGAAWSTDGGATWVKNGPPFGSGGTLVAATGLATGDFIFATCVTSKTVYRCELGPSNPANEFKDMNLLVNNPASNGETSTGLYLVNGVLYAISANATGTFLNSTLSPTMAPGGYHGAASWRTQFSNLAFNTYGLALNMNPVNALRVSTATGKITLWAVNTYYLSTPGTISRGVFYFDDTLALTGPTLTGPVDKALIQTNSVNGAVMNVNLTWNRDSLATSYDVWVGLDKDFNAILNTFTSIGTDTPTVAQVLTTLNTSLNPGATYYWKVRAHNPITSAWSETRSFTMQPVAAAVPEIISPLNGSTITNQSPAFSWTPVTSTTQYDFQLSTTPTFGTTVLTDTPATAGTLVPVTIKLDQGKQYFWRVRASLPIQGDWSAVSNFVVAMPAATTAPPVTVTNPPAITITVPVAPSTVITIPPNVVNQIAPTYIWAIIIIGGILVIAVIVLIVRTRRSV